MFSFLQSFKGKQLKTRLLKPIDELFDLILGIKTFSYKKYSDDRNDPSWKGDYEPSSYKGIFSLLRNVQVGPNTVLIDFGCGLGRVVFASNYLKASRSIGVEFDKDLYQAAEANLLKSKHQGNITFIHGDATSFNIPDNANVFFFFNPFGSKTMADTIKNIEASLASSPRKASIIYYNPLFPEALLSSTVFRIKEQWSANKIRYAAQFWEN